MWQWAHLLGFNLYWLLAVKWQQPGPLLAMLLLHFLFSPSRLRDLRLLPIAVAGCLLDVLLWQLGLFRFPSGFPLWLVLLWLGFALTLAHGMRWLLRLPAGSRRCLAYLAVLPPMWRGPPWGQYTYPGASGSARRCWQ